MADDVLDAEDIAGAPEDPKRHGPGNNVARSVLS